MGIFIGTEEVTKTFEFTNDAGISSFFSTPKTIVYSDKFVPSTLKTSSSNVISGSEIDNVFTSWSTRATNSGNWWADVTSSDVTSVPIYANSTQFSLINPNSIVRPVLRYSLVQGSVSSSTLNVNISKNNTNNTSKQKAIVNIQGAGGGGAGSNPWVVLNYKSGGSGGGSGGNIVVAVEDIFVFSLAAGTGGSGGSVGSNGSNGGTSSIYYSQYVYASGSGGSGGVQGKNQSDGANVGGSGGSTSYAGATRLYYKSGAKGGNSNSSGANIYASATLGKPTFGAYMTDEDDDIFVSFSPDNNNTGKDNPRVARDCSGGRLKTGDSNLGRGGGGGASAYRTLFTDQYYSDTNYGGGYEWTGGDQIFSSSDLDDYNSTLSAGVDSGLSLPKTTAETRIIGPAFGGGGGGASARGSSGDRTSGGRGGHGFVQIYF